MNTQKMNTETIGISPGGEEFADAAVILQERRTKRGDEEVELASAIPSEFKTPAKRHAGFDVTSAESTRSPFVPWSSGSSSNNDSNDSSSGYSPAISSGSIYSSQDSGHSSNSECWRASPSPGPRRSRRTSMVANAPNKASSISAVRPRPCPISHTHSIPTLFRSRTSRRRFSTIPRPLMLKGLKFSEDSDEDNGLASSPNIRFGVGHKSPAPKPEGSFSPVSARPPPQKRAITTVLTEGITTSTGRLLRPCILITPPTPTIAARSAWEPVFSPGIYLHPTWQKKPVIESLGYLDILDFEIEETNEPIVLQSRVAAAPIVRGKQAPFPLRPIRRVGGLEALSRSIDASPPKSAWSDSSPENNSDSDSTRSSAFSDISLDSHSTSPDAVSPSPVPLESSGSVHISPSSDIASPPQIRRARIVPRYAPVMIDLRTMSSDSEDDGKTTVDIAASPLVRSQPKLSAAEAEFRRIEAQMEEADVGDYFKSKRDDDVPTFVPFSPPPRKLNSRPPRKQKSNPKPKSALPSSPKPSSARPKSAQPSSPRPSSSKVKTPLSSQEPWSEIVLTPYAPSDGTGSDSSDSSLSYYSSPRVKRFTSPTTMMNLNAWDM